MITFLRSNATLLGVWLVTLLFVSIDTRAQDSTRTLSAKDITEIKSVNNAEISQNGQYIAYTVRKPADPTEENSSAENHLYVMDLLSEDPKPYVTTFSVSNVRFRPGQNSVTFLGRRGDDSVTSLYEISTQGGEAQKIYTFNSSIAAYEWAPDGNHIAFMANDPEMENKIDSDLPYKPNIYEENLVQHRGYVANVEKNHSPHKIDLEGSIYQIRWSPNGQRLAVAIAPTPLVDDFYMKQQVKITNRHGNKILAEVDHEGKLGQIGWSPDGEYLAMIAGADIHDPIDGRLFVVSDEGGTPNNLQPEFKGKFEQFEWRDEDTINFLASKGTWTTFGNIQRDGSNLETVVDTGGTILQSFSSSNTGTLAFIGSNPEHPAELFTMRRSDSAPQRMTETNPWLEEISFGKQEVVKWSAEDGTELEGVLIYPVNYDREQTYPLITVVHGGPEAHYSNGWVTDYSDPGQLGASEGYFVFYPNYRGSTGRGEEFAKSSQGDLAGDEFDDIVAGVEELIDVGAVDEEKVGVTGGSYGGYATAWMATRYTEKFAAGVMFVGISNNISKWGTSDIPEELYLVHARKRIWDDYQHYLERSPIYHAGEAETPLLILHGEEDTRVSPSQSYELYRHIKTRTDTPVRLVTYPGEGHGNSRATAQFDYTLRMIRWFNEYLMGDKEFPKGDIDSTLWEKKEEK